MELTKISKYELGSKGAFKVESLPNLLSFAIAARSLMPESL